MPGYVYTPEKGYSWIENGKIVYSPTPPPGFTHTPSPGEAEGYGRSAPEESTAWDVERQVSESAFVPQTPGQSFQIGIQEVHQIYTSAAETAYEAEKMKAEKFLDPEERIFWLQTARAEYMLNKQKIEGIVNEAEQLFYQQQDKDTLTNKQLYEISDKIKNSLLSKMPVKLPSIPRAKQPSQQEIMRQKYAKMMSGESVGAPTTIPSVFQKTNEKLDLYRPITGLWRGFGAPTSMADEPQMPKSLDEFTKTIKSIKDRDKAKGYYDKWIHLYK